MVFLVAFVLPWFLTAEKILLLPYDHPGHVTLFANAGRALKNGGHDVYIIAKAKYRMLLDTTSLHAILIDEEPVNLVSEETYHEFEQALMINDVSGPMSAFEGITEAMTRLADTILSTDDVISKLTDLRFHMAIVDGVPFGRNLYVVPLKLGLRYLTMTSAHTPWTVGLPAMPSVEPSLLLPVSRPPSFIDRAKTLVAHLAIHLLPSYIHRRRDLISKHVPESNITSVTDLYHKSELWFINLEIACLHYPMVSAPHLQFIGGLGVKPAKPLDGELGRIADKAIHGLVVVSFGSGIKKIPQVIMQKLLEVFRQLPQSAIIRHDDNPPTDLPSNVLMMRWLPQNDLLAHPNTKAFVTHCGTNGQLEALSHGVPMVAMPFWLDQLTNAKAMSHKGFGIIVDPRAFDSSDFHKALTSVINDPSYRETIQRCSEIFHSLPKANETILLWVDHILRHGSAHLRPDALDIPLWKLFMLDILLSVLVVLHLGVFCCWRLIRACCCRKREAKAKRD